MASTESVDGRSRPRPGVQVQRQRLAQAATRVFARDGATAVSIQAICSEAGVSRPTFYRCFDDLQALIEHLYDEAVERWVQQFFLTDVPSSNEGWLEEAVEAMVDAILAEPDQARFVFAEYGNPASPVRDAINATFERSARRMRRDDADAPATMTLMALMAAIQWVLVETLRAHPVTVDARRRAKQTILELARVTVRRSEP